MWGWTNSGVLKEGTRAQLGVLRVLGMRALRQMRVKTLGDKGEQSMFPCCMWSRLGEPWSREPVWIWVLGVFGEVELELVFRVSRGLVGWRRQGRQLRQRENVHKSEERMMCDMTVIRWSKGSMTYLTIPLFLSNLSFRKGQHLFSPDKSSI